MTISSDNVDPDQLEQPRRWDLRFIQRFMVVFGLLSSVFDYATFGVLFWMGRQMAESSQAFQSLFHTGWYVESVISASLVVYIYRTRLGLLKSHPSRTMLMATGLVILLTIALPYTPLAGLFEFSTLPPIFLLAVLVIVALYLGSAVITRNLFYRRMGIPGQRRTRRPRAAAILR
jgi:Mg2+-importing ATPase